MDLNDELDRGCIYCGVDCDQDHPQHAVDCPQSTGVYPVTEQDLGVRGPNDPYAHGMRCMDCEAEFKVGDFYTHRTIQEADPDAPNEWAAAPIYEVICLGCAALEATS